jgi:hypothetical protein
VDFLPPPSARPKVATRVAIAKTPKPEAGNAVPAVPKSMSRKAPAPRPVTRRMVAKSGKGAKADDPVTAVAPAIGPADGMATAELPPLSAIPDIAASAGASLRESSFQPVI